MQNSRLALVPPALPLILCLILFFVPSIPTPRYGEATCGSFRLGDKMRTECAAPMCEGWNNTGPLFSRLFSRFAGSYYPQPLLLLGVLLAALFFKIEDQRRQAIIRGALGACALVLLVWFCVLHLNSYAEISMESEYGELKMCGTPALSWPFIMMGLALAAFIRVQFYRIADDRAEHSLS